MNELEEPLLKNGGETNRVTIHGEEVDLTHLFLRDTNGEMYVSAGNKTDALQNNGENGREESGGGAAGGTSSLSLDDSSTAPSPPITLSTKVLEKLSAVHRRSRSAVFAARSQFSSLFVTSRLSSQPSAQPSSQTTSRPDSSKGSGFARFKKWNLCKKGSRNARSNCSGTLTKSSSLAFSKSTPLFFSLIIPLLIIANHILFYKGQTDLMWKLQYTTNITITADADGQKSKLLAQALNLPKHRSFDSHESKVVEDFTYMDAIRKLWDAQGLDDKRTSQLAAALLVIFSGIWPHLKLFLLHLCWFLKFSHTYSHPQSRKPHHRQSLCCSCNSLSCCCSNGHAHQSSTSRSPILRTLSTLGKWSLADVLVVCIMISVLHLDWKVDPQEIRSGLEKELPTLLEYAKAKYPHSAPACTKLLGQDCGTKVNLLRPKCTACIEAIRSIYGHPGWATSEGKDILEEIKLDGGGYANLRIVGMTGTYFFCGAVLLSILCSLIVDVVDEWDRKRVDKELVRLAEIGFGYENVVSGPLGENKGGEEFFDLGGNGSGGGVLNDALMLDHPSSNSNTHRHGSTSSATSRYPLPPSPTTNFHFLNNTLLFLLSLVSIPLVCFAVRIPTMERLVFGGIPTLLHEVLGIVWEEKFSIVTLVKTTGEAGGWDTFLMVTFGLFVIIGPLLRSLFLALNIVISIPLALLGECLDRPRQRTTMRRILHSLFSSFQSLLYPLIDALGAFCAWEVLIIAVVMVQLEMPSITDTIYKDDRCREADPEHGRTCVEVQFNTLDEFLLVGVAFAVLVGSSLLTLHLASVAESERRRKKELVRYEWGADYPPARSTTQEQELDGESIGAACMSRERGMGYSSVRREDDGLDEVVFV